MNNVKKTTVFTFIILLFWMAVIFIMSAQPADESSQLSGGIVSRLIAAFFHKFDFLPVESQGNITHALTFIVRKTAHFLEYFILGLLSNLVMLTHSKQKCKRNAVVSVLFCVIYAISDEIHQYFVPGRACRLMDVCIDTVGSITAIALITAVILCKKRRRSGELDAKKETD